MVTAGAEMFANAVFGGEFLEGTDVQGAYVLRSSPSSRRRQLQQQQQQQRRRRRRRGAAGQVV